MMGMGNAQCNDAKRIPEISEQFEDLCKSIEEAKALVTALEDRIKPILNNRPANDESGCLAECTPAAPFAVSIKTQVISVRGLCEHL
jgi:hypothetical protein